MPSWCPTEMAAMGHSCPFCAQIGRLQSVVLKQKSLGNPLGNQGFLWWAWQGLNLRPLRCQHSALPLSYTPVAPGL